MLFVQDRFSSKKSRRVVVCGCLLLAAFAFSALGYVRSKSNSSLLAKSDARPPETLAQRSPGAVQVARFALYDVGIYPSEARVKHGRVVISLVDYTGGTTGLIVERETNGLRQYAGQVVRQGAHWRGRQELNLTPGTYRLYDGSHPENRATLVVEP